MHPWQLALDRHLCVRKFDEVRREPALKRQLRHSQSADGSGLLPTIIERLGRQYPRNVCHMVQSPTTATLEYPELRDRRVDLMLARIKEPFSDEELPSASVTRW
jgi:DNA-binding transcriptional LysR family regulator